MSVMVEYISKESFFHRLNPITKILWTFFVIMLCFLFDNPLMILLVLISNLLISATSKIINNILPIIKALFLFSLLLILFQIFFVSEGSTMFYFIPFLNIGRITDKGLNLSTIMALRMVTTVSTIPILLMTTPITDIVIVLVIKIRVPFKYAFMFITALRFIPVFLCEMEQIFQSQMSRGYNSDTKNPFKKLIIIIPLAIPLLISSINKTQRMAVSMEVRGFGSGPRSYYRKIDFRSQDYIVFAFFILILISALIII